MLQLVAPCLLVNCAAKEQDFRGRWRRWWAAQAYFVRCACIALGGCLQQQGPVCPRQRSCSGGVLLPCVELLGITEAAQTRQQQLAACVLV